MKTKLLLTTAALLWLAPTATAQTLQIKGAASMAPNSPALKDRQIGIARDTKRLWIGLQNTDGTTSNWCLSLIGPTGPQGPAGANGATPTFTLGTTTTLAAGSPASANLTGTAPNYILNLGLPVGATGGQGVAGTNGANGAAGSAATVTIGTTATLASNATPTVTNTGTTSAAVFAFGLPAGAGTLIRNVRGGAVPAIALGALGVPGVGQVTVTFATPFADANYIAQGSFRKTSAGLNVNLSLTCSVRSQTASSVTFDITTTGLALLGGNALLDVSAIHDP